MTHICGASSHQSKHKLTVNILSQMSWYPERTVGGINGIACRCCSNYTFILDLTTGFSVLGKGNCTTRRETFKFWDLMPPILELTVCVLSKLCCYSLIVIIILSSIDSSVQVLSHDSPQGVTFIVILDFIAAIGRPCREILPWAEHAGWNHH